MPRFHFQAVNSLGAAVQGEVDAADWEQAQKQLLQTGFINPQPVESSKPDVALSPPPPQLGEAESEEVLAHVAQISISHLPLAQGLRAAAAEASTGRVASSLRHMATQIEQGRSLTDVLADSTLRMPPHVRGLVAASMRTGRLGPALDELIEHHRALRLMFWSILGSLSYPLLILSMAAVVMIFFLAWVVPQFDRMFVEMELSLPAMTVSLLQTSRTVVWMVTGPAKWLVAVLGALLFLLVILTASGRGGAGLQRLLQMLPVFGPLWAWSGASGFMYLLATLLDQNVPLPEALRLTGDGMQTSDLRRTGRWLAAQVEGGLTLSDLVESSACLPASAVAVLRWGEQRGLLAEAARTLAEVFADRVHARTAWLRTASPPVVYLFIVLTLGIAIISLFLPLFTLIQALA